MSNETKSTATRILRRHEVEARYGLKRSTIYDAVRVGTFPAPVHLGPRAIGWVESEVETWIAARIAASRPTVA